MNSRERVAAVVAGKKIDRRPFSAALGLYGARLTGCPLDRYYTDAREYLNGVSAIVENIAIDFVLSPLLLTNIAAAFGGKIKYFNKQPPNLIEPAISNLDDLSRLKIPDVDSSPWLVYQREIVRGMKKRYGEKKIIGGLLLGPTEMPIMIAGLGNWLTAFIDHGKHVKQMYEITVPLFIQYANSLIADGADFLVIPAAFTTPNIVTRHLVAKYTVPILREAFAEVKGPIYLHHTGSTYNKFLDLLVGLPNIQGFVTDERDALQESREKIGTKVLMSGINGPNIDRYTPEAIKDKVKAVLNDRAGDPHFVFTLTGADVPYDTPIENITAVSDAIKEFYCGNEP